MSIQSEHLSHKDSRVTLAKELLIKYNEVSTGKNPSRNKSSLLPPARLLDNRQFECTVCSFKKGNGRQTVYLCKCKVPLCIVPCFRLYHTYVDPARYL